jgi:hypothetical protein
MSKRLILPLLLLALPATLLAGPETITCLDLCTGKTFEVNVNHAPSAQLGMGQDGCYVHMDVKSCVEGPTRSEFMHPVWWAAAFWKTLVPWWTPFNPDGGDNAGN